MFLWKFGGIVVYCGGGGVHGAGAEQQRHHRSLDRPGPGGIDYPCGRNSRDLRGQYRNLRDGGAGRDRGIQGGHFGSTARFCVIFGSRPGSRNRPPSASDVEKRLKPQIHFFEERPLGASVPSRTRFSMNFGSPGSLPDPFSEPFLHRFLTQNTLRCKGRYGFTE